MLGNHFWIQVKLKLSRFRESTDASEKKRLHINENNKQNGPPFHEKPDKFFSNTNPSLNKTVESEIIQFTLSGKGSPLGLNRKDSNKEQQKDLKQENKENQPNVQPSKGEEAGIKGVFKKYHNNPERIVEEQGKKIRFFELNVKDAPGSLNDLSKSGLVMLKKKYHEKFEELTKVQNQFLIIFYHFLGSIQCDCCWSK